MNTKIANPFVRTVTKHGKEFFHYLGKNQPNILSGCAVAGVILAVGLAVKASKPALKHIKQAKIEHRNRIVIPDGDEREDFELTEEEIESIQLKPLEVVQAVWKDYVPTAIAVAGTTACIIGARAASARQTAAMAALYSVSEQALKDYKGKTEELVGKGKADKIKDAVAEEQLKRKPYDPQHPIPLGQGDVVCFDGMTGRYFPSNMQKILTAKAELNKRLAYGERVTLNDFYYEVGLDGVSFGEESGWSDINEIDLEFTSSLMSDGTPVLVVNHKERNKPTAWYYD